MARASSKINDCKSNPIAHSCRVLVGPCFIWNPPSDPWKKNSKATKTTKMGTSLDLPAKTCIGSYKFATIYVHTEVFCHAERPAACTDFQHFAIRLPQAS